MTQNEQNIDAKANEIMDQLTLDEKLSMMDGDPAFWQGLGDMMHGGYNAHTWPAGVLPEHGIPGIEFTDGPRGIILKGSTTFPASMARGASWDVELEEKVGEVIGKELRAHGGNFFGGVCINLPRHPAWGRAQETYGEDPVLLGKMGVALSNGVQKYAMACAKHYALNSMENSRFQVDVKINDRALHEIYLPHFKMLADSGVASIMSSYNAMNGEWCGQHKKLLRDILKEKWGFEGFVITDFIFGMKDAKKAALAGQDIEMPFQKIYHQDLKKLVESGEVPLALIDEAAFRIIRQQLKLIKPVDFGEEVIGCEAHRELAREVAEKSMVLLKNENNLLPLKNVKKLAVIGRLVDLPITGDGGSSNTQPEYMITPLQGIRNKFGDKTEILYNDGADQSAAVAIAKEVDAVVLIVGYTHDDEGEYIPPSLFVEQSESFPPPVTEEDKKIAEGMFSSGKDEDVSSFAVGGDRKDLNLRTYDEALIKAVSAANKNTIVSIIAGSTVLMENWRNNVPAIMMQWYAGMEGGNALADILSGAVNPSGKLPFVVPQSADDLPFFEIDTDDITYDLWHGYRKLDRDQKIPAFPFGFGLSYTTFEYSNLQLNNDIFGVNETIELQFDLTNTGSMNGEEVFQLYVSAIGSKVERAERELKGFKKVAVNSGQSEHVSIELPVADLGYYNEDIGDFEVECIKYELMVGRHSLDKKGLKAVIEVS